jgi:hypothetical protein
MAESQESLVLHIIESLQKVDLETTDIDPLLSYLYTAKSSLSEYLRELETFISLNSPSNKERQSAGYLLEKIVLLSFSGLKGYTCVKSFQSAGPQHDLLISGDTITWKTLCETLGFGNCCDCILIESKAIKAKVGDNQFARLCNVIDINLTQVGVGIFFTLNGASGFPEVDSPRQRKIGDARLRQALFFAKTRKPIIVFDKIDILNLGKNGSLPKIIKRKIRDIQELSGLPCALLEICTEVDLPPHLRDLIT